MPKSNTLIYLVRRDLRVSDNPILHHLVSSPGHGFTHLLPVYIIPPHQIQVSGLLKDGTTSPFPEARSEVGGLWRCGPHRAKFIAQSIWNMKDNLLRLKSDLYIRVGNSSQVLKNIVDGLKAHQHDVGAVWMIGEVGYEEEREEKRIAKTCSSLGIDLQVWTDEKYFVDDRDLKLDKPHDLPDIFTTYRKTMEPLREKPRAPLPPPAEGSLPALVEHSIVPEQEEPFEIPSSLDQLEEALLRPLSSALPNVTPLDEIKSAHPFRGGEDKARDRLHYLIQSGHAHSYKNSRNGLLGTDFSTKLSAYLAQGCITARQVHEALMVYEDGKEEKFAEAQGYGEGENEGTKAIRFELLWRDYMRLCTRKFKNKLFQRSGFKDDYNNKWKSGKPDESNKDQSQTEEEVSKIIQRVYEGTTGMGLIDASQRELIYTGYTSNRARQNVASFLTKHLGIDWRYGAEWYEMLLTDYDVSSNWANWQYVSGVGNDPRGEARIFNPVKQAFDYDKDGEYVRCWVPEVRKLEKLENVFQAWTTPKEDWDRLGLTGLLMAEDPVKKIEFSVEGKPKNSKRPFIRRRGRGGRGGQPSRPPTAPQQSSSDDKVPQGQHQNNPPPQGIGHPRGGSRGGRGYGGGYRGRGHGGPRGGFRGGRGQFQHGVPQAPRAMQPWFPPPPAQ
ncbi:DASH family cryptochrome [Biscogniauxia marginata]|nr:DASH family cryptochrome [Biscogniauxia marginata]